MTETNHRDPSTLPHESPRERDSRERLTRLLTETPIPPQYLIDNLAVYLRRAQLTDLLAMDALYRMILTVPGVIMEFGVLHGRHLATFTALRGAREPYNSVRRIIGFDTFTGFPDIAAVDDVSPSSVAGRFAVSADHPAHLAQVLAAHEATDPFDEVRRSFVVQGDVRETVPRYLAENPETVIALAYFDLDLYEPTRDTLRAIQPYLTRGSVVAFDELAHARWPGETLAVRDILGGDRVRLRQIPGREPPVVYLRWGE